MKAPAWWFPGVATCVLVSVAHGQQTDARILEYATKYVCGTRTSSPNQNQFDAVSLGVYHTAVNVHNPNADTVSFYFKLASTQQRPIGGNIVSGGVLGLRSDQALEIDCAEILKLLGAKFSKGFLVIQSVKDLDVVAVYTAGPRGEVQTMEVERTQARGLNACPDLTLAALPRPVPRAGKTSLDVTVINIGNTTATNVEVYLEDPNHAGADRIVTTTIPSVPPGATVTVTLQLPFEVQGNANMAALVVIVDPKNTIAECREDNNRRTVGAI